MVPQCSEPTSLRTARSDGEPNTENDVNAKALAKNDNAEQSQAGTKAVIKEEEGPTKAAIEEEEDPTKAAIEEEEGVNRGVVCKREGGKQARVVNRCEVVCKSVWV
jgi:hypothetical protein